MADYRRYYDDGDDFWLKHRWDREVWCQSCKIHHGSRGEAKRKCEERKKAAAEDAERLVQTRRSISPCYHDFQERASLGREESPNVMAPPSPSRANHAAEAWTFYLQREEQKLKESAGKIEQKIEPQRILRPMLTSCNPVLQPREDTIPLAQYPYVTPSTFQYQPVVAPSPVPQKVQNRAPLNPQPAQQTINIPSSTAEILESLNGAVENLQRLPPINPEIFGPKPNISLRDHGSSPQSGRTDAEPHFRSGHSPYSNIHDQYQEPTAVSNRSHDNQGAENFFSPYPAPNPPPPAVRKRKGRPRLEGISRIHHPSTEQKPKFTMRPAAARSQPPHSTAEQDARLSTLRSRKRKNSLRVEDLLCAEEEGIDSVDFEDGQAPRASTRQRLSSPTSSAAITPRPHKSPIYTSKFISEEEEAEDGEEMPRHLQNQGDWKAVNEKGNENQEEHGD